MRTTISCTVAPSVLRGVRLAMFALAALVLCLGAAQPARTQVNSPTYQGNNARNGVNAQEIILTPDNVNPNSFGQLFTYPVDGYVYAQPLYLSNITIPGKGPHNVVFVATENDSVYAFDADDPTGANAPYLWFASLIPNGETTVPYADVGTFDINPQIGITGTPVIDTLHGTLYAVTKTKDAQGAYHQRLHALDMLTGLEKPGSPTEITATASGIGDGAVNGIITFNPLRQNQRPALLLSNGLVYITWASHGDQLGDPLNGTYPEGYHGWVIAYHYGEISHVFVQVAAFNTTPNGITQGAALAAGGIWMAGAGPAADSAGNVFFITGNGDFNGITDYGDSFVKLVPDLAFASYFTPYEQETLTLTDDDLGSGGLLLLPDTLSVNGHSPLMVGTGKEGNIYVIDRGNLGQNGSLLDGSPYTDYVVQKLNRAIGPCFGTPAWFNNTLYYGGIFDTLKAFSFVTTQAQNVNYATGFAGATDLSLNGAAINGTTLALTDGGIFEAHSAFTTQKVNTAQFQCAFQFQLLSAQACGFTFTLQNVSPTAVGANASDIGYGGTGNANPGIGNSVAVKFNFFPNAPGEGGSSTGLYYGGNSPFAPFTNLDNPYGVVISNGDIFDVAMSYDGTTLSVTITDTGNTDPSIQPPPTGPSVTLNYTIDIPGKIGSQFAYAGFTAGTNAQSATQEILNWEYTAPAANSTDLTLVDQAAEVFAYPGTTPAISANGTSNGIVWAREMSSPDAAVHTTTLHAYDAEDLTTELYNSDMSGTRDTIGPGVKFSVPVIANGKVFLGTQTQLMAFGLLNQNYPILTMSYSELRRIGNNYLVYLTITNVGNLQATNVLLNGCTLGAASRPSRVPLPLKLGTLLPGQSITGSLTFPLSAGASGSAASLGISVSGVKKDGTVSNFSNTFSVTLPY